MARRRTKSESGPQGVRESGEDAIALTIDYVKQETLGPLKGLGRFLAWGVAGSFAMALGLLLLLIGVLRVLQDETGTSLTGDWSWVPYFVVSVLGLGVVGIATWRITAGPAQPKLPKAPKDLAPTATPEAASQPGASTAAPTPTPAPSAVAATEEGTN
jgi:hypothetical protein